MALLAFLAAAGMCGRHPAYRLVPNFTAAAYARAASAVRAERRVAFRLEPKRWGIDAHARGAYRLASDAARNFSGSVSAVGTSRDLAALALRTASQVFVRNANAQLVLELRTYDRVTDSGRAQDQGPSFGFPGGANCP